MEPSPVHPAMGYLATCLKNPEMVVPDKFVSELHVLTLPVAYGELKQHRFSACAVSASLWGDSHIPLFSPLTAISGYVLPPFWLPVFLHPGAVCNHISEPSALSALLR